MVDSLSTFLLATSPENLVEFPPMPPAVQEPVNEPGSSGGPNTALPAGCDSAASADAEQPVESAGHPDDQTLEKGSAAVYLYASAGRILPLSDTSLQGVLDYRTRLLENCSNPDDLIEKMLVESLALAFHNSGLMLVKASSTNQPQAAGIYGAVATHLMAELRRGTLALMEYRQKASIVRHERHHGADKPDSEAVPVPTSVAANGKGHRDTKQPTPEPVVASANGTGNGKSRHSTKKPIPEPVPASGNGKTNGKSHGTKQGGKAGDIPEWAQGRRGYNPIPVESLQAAGTG
jgi:hypothetical protein